MARSLCSSLLLMAAAVSAQTEKAVYAHFMVFAFLFPSYKGLCPSTIVGPTELLPSLVLSKTSQLMTGKSISSRQRKLASMDSHLTVPRRGSTRTRPSSWLTPMPLRRSLTSRCSSHSTLPTGLLETLSSSQTLWGTTAPIQLKHTTMEVPSLAHLLETP